MSKKFTTLIAEDDPISFELYKIRLQDKNVNIIHAPNGKIAVDQIKQNPEIDLILMDIRMPILDGYQATQQIREFNKNVPIIAQTAYATIPEHQKILELGFTEFFSKPLDSNILSNIIDKYKCKN